jgi:predicted PurR-regulated permease PerM
VIGGLLAFGLVGIFIGPVVLAVAYTLLQSWIAEESATAEAASRPRIAEQGRRDLADHA